jgi:ligand-binding sensor domain-containing protein
MMRAFRALVFVLPFVPIVASGQVSAWAVFDTAHSPLPHNQVQAIASDSSSVWIGTAGGLARYDGAQWATYDTINSPLPSLNIRALATAGRGKVWIGTDRGIALRDGDAWRVFDSTNAPVPDPTVTSLARDAGGAIWAGTEYGLARWDGMQWTMYNDTTTPFVEPLVLSVASDAQGTLWFGTWDPFAFRGRLWKHAGSSWSTTRLDLQALPSSFPEAIAVMDDGTVWMGTSGTTGGQLVNVSGPEWVIYNRHNSGLPAGGISSMAARGQVLWIGTGSGLVRYDGTTWTTYNRENSGLPEDVVLSVGIDAQGKIWAGTLSGGVAVFTPGVVAGAEGEDSGVPEGIALLQNYPNPFNGTTTIRFRIPERMHVSLRVHDVLGREVAVLTDGTLDAGEHALQWSAPAAASGAYYCTLRTPLVTRTRALVVVR